MSVQWHMGDPDNAPELRDVIRPGITWQIGVGTDNGDVTLVVNSSDGETKAAIDITPVVAQLVAALLAGKQRVGK